ncbi:MAG TPA: ABC transporter permease [Tepidisphaeraceae bacterium]|nr:ABC transporter permease [Tepidisphaeraceae bacterium]
MKKELGIGILLVVLVIVLRLLNPRFLSPINVQNLSNLVGIFGIFSIGLGVIIITGGIDLSVGSVFALQGVLLSMMLVQGHWPWPVAALSAIAIVVLLGVFHGFIITVVKLQPFIVTLCGLLFYRGLARFIANDETKGFGSDSFGLLRPMATKVLYIGDWGIGMPFVLLMIIAVIMWVVLHRSVYGRYLYAVGRNEEAARYSGINTKLVIGGAYALSMLLASITGILLAFYTNSISPNDHGNSYELYGIAAAVLGGCSLRGGEGSIIGIILGTILLQVLRNLVTLLHIPSSLDLAVMGAVIFIGVTIDQLLGTRKKRTKTPALVQQTDAIPAKPAVGGPTP